MTASNKLFCLF